MLERRGHVIEIALVASAVACAIVAVSVSSRECTVSNWPRYSSYASLTITAGYLLVVALRYRKEYVDEYSFVERPSHPWSKVGLIIFDCPDLCVVGGTGRRKLQ